MCLQTLVKGSPVAKNNNDVSVSNKTKPVNYLQHATERIHLICIPVHVVIDVTSR